MKKYGAVEACQVLGITNAELGKRLEAAKVADVKITKEGVTVLSNTVRTLEDALETANVDLNKYDVTNYVVNKWDCAAKDEDRFMTTELWQVKIWLKPRKKYDFIEVFRDIIRSEVKPEFAPVEFPKKDGPHMLEVSLYDHHFGKLCWGLETGTNYDLKISEQLYAYAIDSMLQRVGHAHIDKILFPIGNDFYNCDNWDNTTTKGTPQSVDGRFQKIFRVGCKAVIQAVKKCLEVAPVEIIWVPGNHDLQTSWYLTEVVGAVFENHPHVEVDSDPSARKYKTYGINLLGFTHGNEEKHGDLPMLMANEVPHLWAQSLYRSWRIGHFHKKKEIRFNFCDTVEGVTIVTMPSMSGTDSWHYRRGYVGSPRAAQAHLWNRDEGYFGYFEVNAKDWI